MRASLSDRVPLLAVVLPRLDLVPLDASPLRRERPVVVTEEDAAVSALYALVLAPQPLSQMQPVMFAGILWPCRFIRPMPERFLHHGTRDLQYRPCLAQRGTGATMIEALQRRSNLLRGGCMEPTAAPSGNH